jgi:hypothetical protein
MMIYILTPHDVLRFTVILNSGISIPLITSRRVLSYLLDPILTIALEGGPMKIIPSSASRSANLAFSLRNPYL